jgi:hypothetical protein
MERGEEVSRLRNSRPFLLRAGSFHPGRLIEAATKSTINPSALGQHRGPLEVCPGLSLYKSQQIQHGSTCSLEVEPATQELGRHPARGPSQWLECSRFPPSSSAHPLVPRLAPPVRCYLRIEICLRSRESFVFYERSVPSSRSSCIPGFGRTSVVSSPPGSRPGDVHPCAPIQYINHGA